MNEQPAVNRWKLGARWIGDEEPPLVIAEAGINHDGDVSKAMRMVDEAHAAGCECVKFQCHVVDDEMIPNDVLPGNAGESIWRIVERASLSRDDERRVKDYVESKGMIYLSTPFSRAAADRLAGMGVAAFKIGSGECNNYPLVRHVAAFGRPVILSTGMNDLASVAGAVEILRDVGADYAVLQCTSVYPTPHELVRLGALCQLRERFSDGVVGLSDHSMGNYACFAAVALGARVLEKHFTCDRSWPGPDNTMSIEPAELKDLVAGAEAVFKSLGGQKEVLPEERTTIEFAYASVVAIHDIRAGEALTLDNVWVKRPGTGEIRAAKLDEVLGCVATRAIARDTQIQWSDVCAASVSSREREPITAS